MKTRTDFVVGIIEQFDAEFMPDQANRRAVSFGLEKKFGEWNVPELQTLAITLNNDVVTSIVVNSMQKPKNQYVRVTDKQRAVVTNALLAKYGTSRAVYATALGISESELTAN
ncbi:MULTISPECIES: hypothetical protein [Pectobacterium]|uniref:hypothetical protein n=1 Tax=Pectobacterium TaxID=122277 RepID=UPI001373DF77|nr:MULTISPECIES: hypothetical protein [Pectobacterium]QHP82835.1 hypothetical protein EO763_23385 [Pectobacterium odoriferum]